MSERNCECKCELPLNSTRKICLPDRTFETTMVQMSPNRPQCVDGTVENCSGIEWCISVNIPFKVCEIPDGPFKFVPIEVAGCDTSDWSGCSMDVYVVNTNDEGQDGSIVFGSTTPVSDVKVKNNGKNCFFDFDACFTLTGSQNDTPVFGVVDFFCEGVTKNCLYKSNVYVPEPVDDEAFNQKYPYYDRQPYISATGYLGQGIQTGIAPIG